LPYRIFINFLFIWQAIVEAVRFYGGPFFLFIFSCILAETFILSGVTFIDAGN